MLAGNIRRWVLVEDSTAFSVGAAILPILIALHPQLADNLLTVSSNCSPSKVFRP
jgi:hypothetical protein